MKLKTFSIEEEKLEVLRKLSKETGIPHSLLIRRAIDNLLKDREKLKKRVFYRLRQVKLVRRLDGFLFKN